jgi:hypothetical protein
VIEYKKGDKIRSQIPSDKFEYAWSSDRASFFAHAVRVTTYGVACRGVCEAYLGQDPGDYPSSSLAEGKPKCGICREVLKERYGFTEQPGVVPPAPST